MSTTTSQRPPLREIPLEQALTPRPGECYATMSIGQWDTIHAAAYDLGWMLLELDDDEQLVRAYQRVAPEAN